MKQQTRSMVIDGKERSYKLKCYQPQRVVETYYDVLEPRIAHYFRFFAKDDEVPTFKIKIGDIVDMYTVYPDTYFHTTLVWNMQEEWEVALETEPRL